MRRFWLLFLMLYAGSLLFIPLARDEVLTYHEVACAQPAREMLTSGDWVLPTFAGVPCLHKPPLIHWSIAAAMKLVGRQSEAAARLPAALAGIIVCLVIGLWAARWFGYLVGLVAGFVQVTSVYFQTQARLAETDILLAAAVAAAIGTFAFANIPAPTGLPRQGGWLAGLFYLSAAAACLAKGPVGLILILGPCLAYTLLSRDRFGLRFLAKPAGIGIFLLATLPWFVLVYRKHPPILQAWLSDNVLRFTTGLGTETPPWYYLGSSLWYLLPWTPFVAVGLVRAWDSLWGHFDRGTDEGAGENAGGEGKSLLLLLLWFLFGFVFFTVSSYRSHHYLVPILPPLSVFAALGYLAWLKWRAGASRLVPVGLLVLTISGGLLALWAIGRFIPADKASVLLPLVAVLIGGLAVMLFLDQKGHWRASLAFTFSLAWVLILSVQFLVVPHFDVYYDQVQLARRIAERIPHGAPFHLVELPDNQIMFYLTPPVRREDRLDRFEKNLAGAPPQLFILSKASVARRLQDWGKVEVLDQCPSVRPGRGEADRLTLLKLSVAGQR